MKKIFFVAGEASGDMHGANLIRALTMHEPNIYCFGLGGKRMESAGMDLMYDLAGEAVMGFVEVVRRLKPLRRVFLEAVARVQGDRPDAVVLIDYPGFNIRFARAIHELDIPIIYYISPQVWAWKRKRLDTLAHLVTKMLVILPFEEELYRDKGVDCIYVGHPLLDELSRYQRPATPALKNTIGLLPGSRSQEITRLAPLMAETAAALLQEYPDIRFLIPCVSEARAHQVEHYFKGLPVEIWVDGTYDVLSQVRCCLVASGTATLETALFGVPLCIVYRVNPASYWIARLLVRVRFIGIVNIIASRPIVPELIQKDARTEKILPILRSLIEDTEVRRTMLENFQYLTRRLGGPGASDRAAHEILELLNRR